MAETSGSAVRWWTYAVIEGRKSCKKNPRHSVPTSSAFFFSFSHFPPLFLPFPFPNHAGNRRRLYLSAVHVAVRLIPFIHPTSARSLSLFFVSSFFLVFILARLKGTYICMAACTPLLCEILGASIEREDLSRRCQERPSSMYESLCKRRVCALVCMVLASVSCSLI